MLLITQNPKGSLFQIDARTSFAVGGVRFGDLGIFCVWYVGGFGVLRNWPSPVLSHECHDKYNYVANPAPFHKQWGSSNFYQIPKSIF